MKKKYHSRSPGRKADYTSPDPFDSAREKESVSDLGAAWVRRRTRTGAYLAALLAELSDRKGREG